MSSNAPASDPLSPRVMGAGLATVGLLTLMASPAPDVQSLGVALVCLLGFVVCFLIPRPRPAPEELPQANPAAAGTEASASDDTAPDTEAQKNGNTQGQRATNETRQAPRAPARHRQVVRGS